MVSSEKNSEPEWTLREEDSEDRLQRAKKLIENENKDLSVVPWMIYYEESEKESVEWVTRSHSHQRPVQRYKKRHYIRNKLKRFHLSEPQRNVFEYWLKKVIRMQLADRTKFIVFDVCLK
ncbi:hypothetical protein CHS0354_008746 [Potamilus streckersoni]|uniref:Uncharacterized protein n=1 Tax=Potamilus streckersoni TaxID=2493646 RepID=A0AAE0T605_9BIVA|nr:hypothetical protein CHS0354_008746 [Potamilus streckersoni]